MAAAIALREDFSADDLRALARQSRDTRQCRRLLALAAVGEGRSRAEAAKIGGMDRQTLRDWVHRFNSEGSEGLIDLKAVIEERFGVVYHDRSVFRVLRELGFLHLSARPCHPAQKVEVLEAFKNVWPAPGLQAVSL